MLYNNKIDLQLFNFLHSYSENKFTAFNALLHVTYFLFRFMYYQRKACLLHITFCIVQWHNYLHLFLSLGPTNPRQTAVVEAFKYSWQAYKQHAWGKDQLKPLSQSHHTWFDLGLTLIDSLDTMYIMGLKSGMLSGPVSSLPRSSVYYTSLVAYCLLCNILHTYCILCSILMF